MGKFVLFFKVGKRGMRVHLGCCYAFVTEQLLDGLKVGAVIKHGRSKGVTQHVRAFLRCVVTKDR